MDSGTGGSKTTWVTGQRTDEVTTGRCRVSPGGLVNCVLTHCRGTGVLSSCGPPGLWRYQPQAPPRAPPGSWTRTHCPRATSPTASLCLRAVPSRLSVSTSSRPRADRGCRSYRMGKGVGMGAPFWLKCRIHETTWGSQRGALPGGSLGLWIKRPGRSDAFERGQEPPRELLANIPFLWAQPGPTPSSSRFPQPGSPHCPRRPLMWLQPPRRP